MPVKASREDLSCDKIQRQTHRSHEAPPALSKKVKYQVPWAKDDWDMTRSIGSVNGGSMFMHCRAFAIYPRSFDSVGLHDCI